MPKRVAIKNHTQEIQLINQRCITVFIIMIILVISLIARLAYLQLANHDHFTTLSQKNWLDLIPLEPTRGLIYDRNGILLAENIPVYSLDLLPYKITNMPKILADIAKIIPLSDDDIAQFHRELKQHRRFDEVTLKLRLSEDEVARFSENQYRFPGVQVKAHLIRHYPFVNSLSHVLGYVGRINIDELQEIDATNYSASNYIGKLGVEKYYEDELHGTVGYEQAETDASGQALRVLNQIKPLPGKNLYLTIDSKLQTAVEEALSGHRGAVVAIQPATGQVLALVSEPSYDPNLFVEGINSKTFQALQQSPDRPLYNRALRGLYPYGSTIKPFIALGGLDTGVASPEATIFDPGWYKLPTSSRIFHDHKRGGHGVINLTRAIISSCDTYFFDLAHKMGIQRLDNSLKKFGFGQLTGIDLEEELPGVLASPAWKRKVKGISWYEGDTLNSGIGQGFMQVTALQLATGVSIIANHGKRFTPHVLLAEQEPGKPLEMQGPTQQEPVELQDPSYWNIVIHAMQSVITSPVGTGIHFGKIGPYSVAAKTGTAQVHSIKNYNLNLSEDHEEQSKLPERLRDNTLFIAFAPVENPKIAIAVIVENYAAASQVARKILDYYLIGPPLVLRLNTMKAQGSPVNVIH
ncbi:MAG TPA: penicillin-binding protein 2 [Gammaproteobacteria bacterium]|nr:penicillin-binding protein 2 [Gammaproteobacteria bacterium]